MIPRVRGRSSRGSARSFAIRRPLRYKDNVERALTIDSVTFPSFATPSSNDADAPVVRDTQSAQLEMPHHGAGRTHHNDHSHSHAHREAIRHAASRREEEERIVVSRLGRAGTVEAT